MKSVGEGAGPALRTRPGRAAVGGAPAGGCALPLEEAGVVGAGPALSGAAAEVACKGPCAAGADTSMLMTTEGPAGVVPVSRSGLPFGSRISIETRKAVPPYQVLDRMQ